MRCCATEVKYKVSFNYLERSLMLTSTTLDLFCSLLVYKIGENNNLAYISQFEFLTVLEGIEIY